MKDKWRHLSILDIRSVRAADCDTDHSLVVAKVSEKIAVNKQISQKFQMERFNLKTLNKVGGEKKYSVGVSNRFAEVEINTLWETVTEKMSKFQP
jgi:hypothetical protein